MFLFALLFLPCFAQSQFAEQQESANDDFATWSIRFYPVALVSGIKVELGHRFKNGFELNLQGKSIYQGFYWYRTYKSQLVSPFYKPSSGYRVMMSLEKRARKPNLSEISFGPKFGYEFISSDAFDASSGEMLPGQNETIQIDRKRYTGAFIVRGRSKQKGVFVEFSAELGMSYNEKNTQSVFVDNDYVDYSTDWESYVLPHVLVGFAVGFGI